MTNQDSKHLADPSTPTPWLGKLFAWGIAGIFLMVGLGLWAIYNFQSKAPRIEPAPLAEPKEPDFN
jgi:hypothetical protein